MNNNSKTGLNTNLWQQNYDEVCAYLSKHNCGLNDIPDDAVNSHGKNLKRWLYEMYKAVYGRITRYSLNDEQIRLLKEIGIDELQSITDRDWYLHFNTLLDFYRENGHIKIPFDKLCPDGKSLLGWTRLQRKKYQEGTLPQKYVDEIISNGAFEILETPLDTAMRHVEEYYKEHGNIDFDTAYICPDGYQLGVWLRTFRDKLANQRNKKPYPKEVLDRLSELGFIVNKSDHNWMQKYRQLIACIEEYGRDALPADIEADDGSSLKDWVKNCKRSYRSGSLSNRRRELLDEIDIFSIGFETDETEKHKFYDKEIALLPNDIDRSEIKDRYDLEGIINFLKLREALTQYGNKPLPADLLSASGNSLMLWAKRHRWQYHSGREPVYRAKLLESIDISGIQFEAEPKPPKPVKEKEIKEGQPEVKEQRWYETVEICRRYIEENGLIFHPEMLSGSGGSLKAWVHHNRGLYLGGKLSEERADALKSICITEIKFRKPSEERKPRVSRPHKKKHPKRPPDMLRTKSFVIQLTEREYAELQAMTHKNGYKHISDLIRDNDTRK